MEDILEVSQYKVTVIEAKCLVGHVNRVETAADQLRLPGRCSVTTRGCQTHDTTYVWIPPRDLCNLEEVRTVKLEKVQNFLVDYVNKVLLMEGLCRHLLDAQLPYYFQRNMTTYFWRNLESSGPR